MAFSPALEQVVASVAVALVVGWQTALLVRLALAVHARVHGFGPCRGVGFLAMGVLSTGLTAVAGTLAPSTLLTAGGLAVAGVLYLLGLLLLPGTTPTVVARLRRALDGAGIGICLLYSAWVCVIAPAGGLPKIDFAVALTASCGIAAAVVTGLRSVRYRRAALACSLGSSLNLAGLALVAWTGGSSLTAMLAVIVGSTAIWLGARRNSQAPAELDPGAADGSLAGYPLLVVPVLGAVAATVWQVANGRPFGVTAVGLGVAGMVLVSVREMLGALDVARYARRIQAREAHFRSLVAASSDVTIVVDENLVVRWQSPAAARQFGLSDQDVLGRPFAGLLHPDDGPMVADRLADVLARTATDERPTLVEARLRDGFDRWRDTESTVSDQRDVPEVGALVLHVRDVGERKDLERTLHRLAFTDQLTGLANRRQLLRTVAAQRKVPGGRGAVLLVALDGLTSINGVRGHDTGDAVLIEVARRLQGSVGPADLPARLGGDEFAVVAEGTPMQAYALATRLVTVLAEAYPLPGTTVHLTACVGLTDLTDEGAVEDTLRRAELALRRAKQAGRGRVEWYDEDMERAILHRMTLEQELPGAIGRGELDLVYQPVLDLQTNHPVGVEALLRWRHPRLGSVPPADFIPVAEDLGLIDEIGEWVLHHSCRQLSRWLRDGLALWLAVNVSVRQVLSTGRGGLLARISAALDTHDLGAERLVIEVAEGSIGPEINRIVAQLAAVRALGVQIALDDFGTGQTSLAHLRRLPIDILKIDRTFFAEPADRTGPAAPIIDVMVGLGRRLGLEIVAEGLEVPAHLDVARAAGCRLGQGVLFGWPETAERVEAFLENHRTPSL